MPSLKLCINILRYLKQIICYYSFWTAYIMYCGRDPCCCKALLGDERVATLHPAGDRRPPQSRLDRPGRRVAPSKPTSISITTFYHCPNLYVFFAFTVGDVSMWHKYLTASIWNCTCANFTRVCFELYFFYLRQIMTTNRALFTNFVTWIVIICLSLWFPRKE